ncbi:aminoglycoside phosphotransferase family protein [Stenotrophomonas sp. TWI1183]|uniref:phosphotransferase enzyme family protein n=1 Tax=Stenotrophomonas sp. TWI1183 TaxID=3136799 RepID=UPI00320A7A75
MLHPQELSSAQITQVLGEAYGVRATAVVQRACGADAGATVYQVGGPDGMRWWLKCRRYAVDAVVWDVVHHLRDHLGLREIIAPLPARDGAAAATWAGLQWTLFPYVDAFSGFEEALSRGHWERFGRVLRQVHDVRLPEALSVRLRCPGFDDDTAVERVGAWLQRADARIPVRDALGEEYLALWCRHRQRIEAIWQRCGALRARIGDGRPRRVLCHADLHAGNVLVGPDEGIHLIDWDEMVLAPRERDLMFIGAGIGGRWGREQPPGFAEGYGPVEADPLWVAYSRHWRILQDLQEFHDLLLEPGATARPPAQRRQALRYMAEQFAPGNVADCATRAWQVAQG